MTNIPSDLLNTITLGDSLELAKRIPDESIDLIFTDPPYPKEYLYLYEWLAEEAARVLKQDGFLMSYSGGYHLDKVMKYYGHHLEYFWQYIEVNSGNSTILWPRQTIARYKSILCYRLKGSTAMPVTNVLGVWNGHASDKRYHKWGQAEDTAKYYIDVFTNDDAIIWDPFSGGGTVPFVCKLLGLDYIAFEIEEESHKKSIKRLEDMQYQTNFFKRPSAIVGDMFKGFEAQE